MAARGAWIALTVATSFFVFEFVARVEPSLAAPEIAAFYHLSNAGFGTLASLFFWIYAPMQILVGLLLDRFGARRFVILGSCCCALGVTAFAWTRTLDIGAAGRVLTGFGASFAFVSALYLVNHWFAPERFAVLSGTVNAAGMVGTAIGAPLLGAAISSAGWRAIFFATGAAGFLIFLAAASFLRTVKSPATVATSTPVEHVRDSLSAVLSNGRVWVLAVVGLLCYMPINVYAVLWGGSELMTDHGVSQASADVLVSLVFWGMAMGSIAGGWIADALDHRKGVLLVGTVLTGLAYCAVLYRPIGNEWALGTLLFLAGFFNGTQMLTFAMAKEGESNALVGTVVAFVNMLGIAGALIFQPLVGLIADATGGDFRIALTTIPACLGAAVLILLFLPEYRHPDHRPGARIPAEAGAPQESA